jgi:hypothetical protein
MLLFVPNTHVSDAIEVGKGSWFITGEVAFDKVLLHLVSI